MIMDHTFLHSSCRESLAILFEILLQFSSITFGMVGISFHFRYLIGKVDDDDKRLCKLFSRFPRDGSFCVLDDASLISGQVSFSFQKALSRVCQHPC